MSTIFVHCIAKVLIILVLFVMLLACSTTVSRREKQVINSSQANLQTINITNTSFIQPPEMAEDTLSRGGEKVTPVFEKYFGYQSLICRSFGLIRSQRHLRYALNSDTPDLDLFSESRGVLNYRVESDVANTAKEIEHFFTSNGIGGRQVNSGSVITIVTTFADIVAIPKAPTASGASSGASAPVGLRGSDSSNRMDGQFDATLGNINDNSTSTFWAMNFNSTGRRIQLSFCIRLAPIERTACTSVSINPLVRSRGKREENWSLEENVGVKTATLMQMVAEFLSRRECND